MKKILLSGLFSLFCLVSFAQKKYSVYVFVAEECPISIYMAKPLKQVVKAYGEQVNFYAVFPKKNSTLETANSFLNTYGLSSFQAKLDTYQAFAKKLKATITPEVVILNEQGTVLYRGRISNAYKAPGRMKHGTRKNELLDILALVIKEETIPQPWAAAIGCFITFQ